MHKSVSTLTDYVKALRSGTKVVFENWVTFDKDATRVFRSSQPYYDHVDDSLQKFDSPAMSLLRIYNIKGIVSLNHHGLYPQSAVALTNEGIAHHHIALADMSAATPQQLLAGCQAIDSILSKGNALVYCGFGQGRTGMMMTAYEIYKLPKGSPRSRFDDLIDASTAEVGSQKQAMTDFYDMQNP